MTHVLSKSDLAETMHDEMSDSRICLVEHWIQDSRLQCAVCLRRLVSEMICCVSLNSVDSLTLSAALSRIVICLHIFKTIQATLNFPRPPFWGCVSLGAIWTQLRFLYNAPTPRVLSSYVYSFGSYRVDKHTNKQTDTAENIPRFSLCCDVG